LSGCSAARLACLVRDQEVGGSNPLTPTIFLSSRYSGKIIMKQSLTIRIPDDLREELREISEEEAKPIDDLIMESIKKYVSIYKYKHKDAIRLGGIWKNIKITDEDIKENREDLLKKIEDKW
jgi:predicted butyrate kinase (DUF1464 family)